MKKFTVLLVTILLSYSGFSYTWNQIGTVEMNATKICFGVTFSDWVICSDDGLYLYNITTHETEFYTYGLPIKGAAYFEPYKILVAMGDDTYSDGIWTFDLQTHQFEVVEWVIYPNFLYHDDFSGIYWVGSQWGGILKSQDGIIWDEVPFFEDKTCTTMAGYGEHLVVSSVSNLINTFWSGDGGETWNNSTNSPIISDMSFSPGGLLYGIFPDYSNSSGLWKSEDFGNTWQVEFYYDNMSAVGFDCFGNPFVGWKEDLGIASYDPSAPPPGLTFLNAGLPNLNLNKIQINPSMSAPALFVCTEAGVFYSQDYWLKIDENQQSGISIFPNPADEVVLITSKIPISSIRLYNVSGKEIFRTKVNNMRQQLDISGFEAGIYFFEIVAEQKHLVKKLIVE